MATTKFNRNRPTTISCNELKVGELAEIIGPTSYPYVGVIVTKIWGGTLVGLHGYESFHPVWSSPPNFELRVLSP